MTYIIFIILYLILIILYYHLTRKIYLFNIEQPIISCPQIIEFNNNAHLGDHIFNTYYFNFLQDFIETNNISIHYYIEEEYHDQVKEFIKSKNVKIFNFELIGINLSILNLNYKNNYFNTFIEDYFKKSKLVYNKFYLKFFNETTTRYLKFCYSNKNLIMTDFLYDNQKLLIEYDNLDNKYKDIDVLIINSIPRTFQVIVDINKWNKFILNLVENNLKIVTTMKVLNHKYIIPSTTDDNLSVFKIAAISTHAKYIIAINTGPASGLFNVYTFNYTQKIYLFDERVTFDFNKIIHVNDLNDIDINKIINFV
jgi:hypothetical protein